jgi:hypothetical protein
MKRYNPALSEEPYQEIAYAEMEEEKDGEYVKYEDHACKIAELKESMNGIVEAVLDNRSKQVTGKTLNVIRTAIDKFDLRRDYKGATK